MMIVLSWAKIWLASGQSLRDLAVEETIGNAKTFPCASKLLNVPLLRFLRRAEQAVTLVIRLSSG